MELQHYSVQHSSAAVLNVSLRVDSAKMAPGDRQFEGLKQQLSSIAKSVELLQKRSWLEKHSLLTWLISLTIPLAALVFAIYAGVLPHLEKHLDSQIKIQVTESLEEPSKRIAAAEQSLAEIRGKFEFYDQMLGDRLRELLKNGARLSPEAFRSALPSLTRTLTAARKANIRIEPELAADLGKRVLELAARNPQEGSLWQSVLEFVNYRSFATPQPAPTETAKTRAPSEEWCRMGPFPFTVRSVTDYSMTTNQEDIAIFQPLTEMVPHIAPCPSLTSLNGQGGDIQIDGYRIRNIIFYNLHIIYRGGPLALDPAAFANCTFDVPPASPRTVDFARALLRSFPATYVSSATG